MESCLHILLLLLLAGVTCLHAQAVPVFQNLPPSVTINETVVPGPNRNVLNVVSRSTNVGNGIYSVSCLPANSLPANACNVFTLTAISVTQAAWNGYLALSQPLDSLATPTYTLSLRAVDSAGQSAIASLSIIITATRIRPPVFSGTTDVEIAQRTAASQETILQYVARDPTSAGRSVNYRILNGTFASYFLLDPVLGRLTNTKPLQYSDPALANGPIRLRIEAAYVFNSVPAWNSPSETSTTIDSTIFLIDQNLNSPTFDSRSYSGSIMETAPASTFVDSIFFTVVDMDMSLTSSSFALTLDNYNNIFQVQPSSGYNRLEARLSIITNQFFNFNNGPRWYSFNIIAQETLSSQRNSNSAAVNVTLIQVNRFAPQFISNPYFSSVPENAVVGTPVVQVQAYDMDVGDFGNSSIRYRFSTGASDLFKIDTQTGLITVANCRTPGVSPCLDYENPALRNNRMLVWAADLRGEGRTGTTTVIVNVTNVNDNQPIFAANNYYASIDDGTTALSPLNPSALATDADNDTLQYSILSGNFNNVWSINPTTGLITPNSPINYSNAPFNGTYKLVISASDGVNRAPATVTIAVTPINRYAPVFQQAVYNVSIFETQPPGASFYKMIATDQDPPSTEGGKVLYRILAGGRGVFSINPNTGDVSVLPGQTLDYRTDPIYNMTIQAYDLGSPSKQAESTLLVYLSPTRPFIGLSDMTYYVTDSLPMNAIVGQIKPITSQLGTNPTFTFSTPQAPQLFDRNLNPIPAPTQDQLQLFTISRAEGNIQVNKPLNAGEVRRWQTQVQVTTSAVNPPLTATSLLTIWLLSSNKVPPTFQYPWTPQNTFYNMTVQQGANFQPIAGSFPATPGNNSLSLIYSLIDPFGFFALQSPTSGIIKQIRPINQTVSNYQLTLTATDNGQPPLSSSATINVLVDSVNQDAPTFSMDQYDSVIYDDVAVATVVTQVSATDQDQGDFGLVRYNLTSPRDRFQIDPVTGMVTIKRSDFNAPTEPYIFLEVRAYDSPRDPPKSKFAISYVNVTVLDANNHAPVFQSANYQTIIYTNLPLTSEVVRVAATDSDAGANARISYSIIQGNDAGLFSLNPTTGSIVLAKPLGTTESNYSLTVQAIDAGTPPKNSSVKVSVLVKARCVDNCNPQWVTPMDYLSRVNVYENTPVNTVISSLAATPYQSQSQLDYSLARNGNISNLAKQIDPFIIQGSNQANAANLAISSPLDYDIKRSYELLIVVKDTSVANSEVLRYMVVSVLPVQTLNPQFPFNPNTFCPLPVLIRVPQGSLANVPVRQVVATPNHIFDSLQYSLQGTSNVPFSISNTGQISPTSTLSTTEAYNFNVKSSYTNTSHNIQQTRQLCTTNGNDQSTVNVRVEVYSLFIENNIVTCFKDTTDQGSVVANLNNFLQYPSDVQFVSYKPTSRNGFTVNANGDVVLQDLQTALANDCESIQDTCNIPVQVARTTINNNTTVTLNLKPYMIAATQPLTLITLNTNLSQFNEGPAKATLLRNLVKKTNNGFLCIVDAGFHTLDTGSFDATSTDVYLYTLGPNLKPIAPMTLDATYHSVQDRQNAGIVGITDAASRWNGFNWEPVAIALGLIVGLVFLACLFFACFCCWGYFSQWCLKKTTEKEPIMAGSTGLVNRAWNSHAALEEHPEPYPFGPEIPDVDILPTESYKSNARRDDVTTVDGAGSSVLGLQAPSGYVHIEAPLSRSASAFGTVDEVDVAAGANAATSANASAAASASSRAAAGRSVETVTETVVQGGYDRDQSRQSYESVYNNHKETAKARAYSSRSGGLDDIDEGDDQKPVQLNQTSATEAASQIGAVLIRPETPRGQGYTQRIVGGEGEMTTSYNYDDTTYSNHDPSRLNMALQNEVVMNNNTAGHTSYYDEGMASVRGYNGEIPLDQYANNVGTTRQEHSYVEQFEETRYL